MKILESLIQPVYEDFFRLHVGCVSPKPKPVFVFFFPSSTYNLLTCVRFLLSLNYLQLVGDKGCGRLEINEDTHAENITKFLLIAYYVMYLAVGMEQFVRHLISEKME
jgi:hypothetical protein